MPFYIGSLSSSAYFVSDIRILAVAAGRGGTGKSTIAFGLADALRTAHPELDVALMDLDPQAGVTGYAKHVPASDPVRDAPVAVHGLKLFRGGRALAHASEAEMKAHLERALAESPSTVLVLDMSPALTDVAHRAVFARDDVMLIGAIKTEPGSFQSMNELVAYVSRRGLSYVLVPTIHRNVLLNNTMLLTMRQQHDGHVADVVVPLDGKAAECVVAGQPVTRYARRAKASKAIVQLVHEVFGDGAESPALDASVAAAVASAGQSGSNRPKPSARRTAPQTAPRAAESGTAVPQPSRARPSRAPRPRPQPARTSDKG